VKVSVQSIKQPDVGEDGQLDASVDACWERAKDGEVWEFGGMIDLIH
jgi:hypothetical protein